MKMLLMRPTSLLLAIAVAGSGATPAAEWRQFRGTDNNTVADKAPPGEWDGASGANVAWKSALPGPAASGPIVVGGKVVVTAVTGFKQDRLHVVAFDVVSGKQLWHRQFWATGRTLCHTFSSVAAPTPAQRRQTRLCLLLVQRPGLSRS